MNTIRSAILCMLLAVIGSIAAWAQPAPPGIDAPLPGAVDVDIRPLITIHAPHHFDPTSITWPLDSLPYGDTSRPSILLIPKIIYDSLADSTHNLLTARGAYFLVGDTLKFRPYGKLCYDTKYIVVIHGLRVINNSMVGPAPTIDSLPDTTFTFTTTPDAHHRIGFSHDAGYASCSDTFKLMVNRAMTSFSSGGTPLMSLEQVDSVIHDTDSTFHYATTPVSASGWFGGTGNRTLFLKPTHALVAGRTYFVRTEIGLLSGDTALDNAVYPVHVREGYHLTVQPVCDLTGYTPPASLVTQSGTTVAFAGDNVTIAAEAKDASYAFLRWECAADSSIDSSTDPILTINQGCSALRDLTINAVYARRDTIEVVVHDTTGIPVTVYRYNDSTGGLDSIGGPGTYLVAPDERLQVLARPTSASFGQWSSTVPEFDGNPSPMIAVTNLKNYGRLYGGVPIGIGPIPEVVPTPYGLCAFVQWVDNIDLPRTALEARDVVTASIGGTVFYRADTCVVSSTQDTRTVTVTVNNDACYEIAQIIWTDPNGGGQIDYLPGSGPSSWSRGFQLTRPPTDVYVSIRPKTYTLTLETSLTDREVGSIGVLKDVRIIAYGVNPRTGKRKVLGCSADGATSLPSSSDFSTIDIKCLCGENVLLVADICSKENGYTFDQWLNTSGYEYPSPNTIATQSFVMDQDRKAQGIFNEGFRLRQIGFYRNDNQSTIEWYTPNELRAWKDPDDGVQKPLNDLEIFHDPSTGYGTRVRFRFNAPVDHTSIEGKPLFTDVSDRIDELDKQSYPANWVTYYNSTKNAKEVEATIRNTSKSIPKGEAFRIDVPADIQKASSSLMIKNPQADLRAETEMPGVNVVIKKIWAMDTQGDGGVEMFSPAKAAVMDATGTAVQETDNHLQLPDNDCYTYVDPVGSEEYNRTVLTYPKMKKNWTVGLSLSTYDNDGESCESDGYGKVWDLDAAEVGAASMAWLGILAGVLITQSGWAFAGIIAGFIGLGVLLGGFGGFIISAIVDLIEGLFSSNPDLMGIGTWLYDWSSFFGAKSTVKSQQTQQDRDDDPQAKWEVDFQLKVDD